MKPPENAGCEEMFSEEGEFSGDVRSVKGAISLVS